MAESISWQTHGAVTLCAKGWPLFPELPEEPGLYRLTLNDGHRYIGEAGNLRRRLYEYRRPTKGIVGEHVVHAAIRAAGGATLELYLEGDLSTRRARCALELAEIAAALAAKDRLLNDDVRANPLTIGLRIAYHEAEITRLRKLLEGA